jgi:hypothetical protein
VKKLKKTLADMALIERLIVSKNTIAAHGLHLKGRGRQ